jgi:hypothetical protein
MRSNFVASTWTSLLARANWWHRNDSRPSDDDHAVLFHVCARYPDVPLWTHGYCPFNCIQDFI